MMLRSVSWEESIALTPARGTQHPRHPPYGVGLNPGHCRRGTLALWLATAASIVLVAAVAFVLVAPNGLADWFPVQATTGTRTAIIAPPSILPLPSPTETFVVHARALFAGGKLRDALRALDRVPAGDTLRPDADRLRADIQRELLAVAGAEAASASITPSVSAPKE